ncbi:MAG TPA: hypothetical protein VFU12_03490 [Glycomyces sp.]|nr:hypothetical protein [Glycomyces sp.]
MALWITSAPWDETGILTWFSTHPATVAVAVITAGANFAFAWFSNRSYFMYDPRSGRIKARRMGGRWHVYPRPGYRRLEFSLVYGEIYEVGFDARRRRKLPITAAWADRDDWKAFIEGFHPEAGFPVAVRTFRFQTGPTG